MNAVGLGGILGRVPFHRGQRRRQFLPESQDRTFQTADGLVCASYMYRSQRAEQAR